MELSRELFIIIFFSYVVGSISPALLIGKAFFHTDIREVGSKNLGGSNAGRVLGKKIGILVIILDILKGFIVVWIASVLSEHNINVMILAGLIGIAGHLFPLFAKFRGGKGVATTGGVLLLIKPILIPISIAIILLFWLITRYESLATLFAFTFLLVIVMLTKIPTIILIAFFVYLGILYAHRTNIKAILSKSEKKKNIFSKFE